MNDFNIPAMLIGFIVGDFFWLWIGLKVATRFALKGESQEKIAFISAICVCLLVIGTGILFGKII